MFLTTVFFDFQSLWFLRCFQIHQLVFQTEHQPSHWTITKPSKEWHSFVTNELLITPKSESNLVNQTVWKMNQKVWFKANCLWALKKCSKLTIQCLKVNRVEELLQFHGVFNLPFWGFSVVLPTTRWTILCFVLRRSLLHEFISSFMKKKWLTPL